MAVPFNEFYAVCCNSNVPGDHHGLFIGQCGLCANRSYHFPHRDLEALKNLPALRMRNNLLSCLGNAIAQHDSRIRINCGKKTPGIGIVAYIPVISGSKRTSQKANICTIRECDNANRVERSRMKLRQFPDIDDTLLKYYG